MAGGGAVVALLGLAGAAALALGSKKKPAAPGAAAPGVAKAGTVELDANLPQQLEAQVLGAIQQSKDPTALNGLAAQLDAMGFHLAASAVRSRGTDLQAQGAPAPAPTDAGPPTGPVAAPATQAPSAQPIGPAPDVPLPAGMTLDTGMDAQTRQTIVAMLTTETDVAKLQGMAAAIQFKYPISAGLLWAKAAALIATAAPAGPALIPSEALLPTPAAPAAPAPAPIIVAPVPPPAPPPAGYKWTLASNADVARDGVQPRYLEVMKNPVGTEVQEMHNNRLWKLRVISNRTDPALTTYAKDVKGWIASLVQGIAPGAPPPPPPAPAAPIQPAQFSPGGTIGTNADVQKAINALGYSPPLVVDGITGPKTQAGVKWFQSSHGLVVDGIPGPKTKAALQAAMAGAPVPAASLATSPQPAYVAVSLPAAPSAPVLRGGTAAVPPPPPMQVVTNSDVQKAINSLGYSPQLVVDGAIGPKSKAGVLWFQRAHGLTADGVPGPITKAALQAALVAQGIAPMQGMMS